MPLYTLKNKNTGEIFEKIMKVSDYVKFMSENSEIERYYDTGIIFADPSRMMDTKSSKGDPTFEKYVLGRIKDSIPGNVLKDKKIQIPKEF